MRKQKMEKLTPDQVIEYLERTQGKLGAWQRAVIRGWDSLKQIRGKAKDYIRRYTRSYFSLLEKLNNAGIYYRGKIGPRGGDHGGLNPDSYEVKA